MIKAKFIQKYYGSGYDRNMIFLEYEYKGHRYTIYENTSKGNEPLSWQHKMAQLEIDKRIEIKEKEKQLTQEEIEVAQKSLDETLDLFMNW